MARFNFKVISRITDIETIARGNGVDARHYLDRRYGHGRWRKLKGYALVEYDTGEISTAELHWFEAHGIGRKEMKSIKDL